MILLAYRILQWVVYLVGLWNQYFRLIFKIYSPYTEHCTRNRHHMHEQELYAQWKSKVSIVQHQLSGLSRASIIWTCSSEANTLMHMHRGWGWWCLGVWYRSRHFAILHINFILTKSDWHDIVCFNAADCDHPIFIVTYALQLSSILNQPCG